MKSDWGFVVFIIVLLASTVITYNVVRDAKFRRDFESYNKMCAIVGDELNRNIANNTPEENENITCISYYCYYGHYAPPEGLEQTSTLCICDCTTAEGEIIKIQVLAGNAEIEPEIGALI